MQTENYGFLYAPIKHHRDVVLRIVLTLDRTYDDCSFASPLPQKTLYMVLRFDAFDSTTPRDDAGALVGHRPIAARRLVGVSMECN